MRQLIRPLQGAMLMWAAFSILFGTGCAAKVLTDSDLPLTVYDVQGHVVDGYRGYSDGMMAELVKGCHDTLDRAGVSP